LRNMVPARSLVYAAASGALAVTRQGPMEGAASQADLDAFLLAHAGKPLP
jgi:tagatose kinase